MTSFPDEVVAAWLNRQDNVLQQSGEPTWSTLEDALRKIGQTGLAEDIDIRGEHEAISDVTSHVYSGGHSERLNSASTQTDSG